MPNSNPPTSIHGQEASHPQQWTKPGRRDDIRSVSIVQRLHSADVPCNWDLHVRISVASHLDKTFWKLAVTVGLWNPKRKKRSRLTAEEQRRRKNVDSLPTT
jgi:hypothetical protein